jgi:peptidoglycan/LPS O-acetylase OafA/YrhL
MLTTVVSLILAFLINMLAAVIYPPDFSGQFPIYSADWVMVVQVSGAFLLIALTVIAMKAEEERQILAAAGFTALAISFGISIMSLFDIVDVVTFDQYEDYYRITVSSNFLLIPAAVLIASYDRFKMWIRYFSVLSVTPLLIASIIFLLGVRNYHLLEITVNVGVVLFSFCWILWAANIYLNYQKDSKV